ncbi:sensor histidine kinase [uncultured Jatrophihabitans sp.]|uniref:sensor histidine kinase n=1 Tax=uncultured Jatrophihabitans sp. TaxID=1610747 RepID=UPI0035CA57C8
MVARLTRWPRQWWARQSLRARLTLLATALFSFAVITGAVLLIVLQGYALTRVLDQSAVKAARSVAPQARGGRPPSVIVPPMPVFGVQIVDAQDNLLSASAGVGAVSLLNSAQLREVRGGARIEVDGPTSDSKLRVLGQVVGPRTVLVANDVTRVEDSQRVLTRAALVGSPIAVLLMAMGTYGIVALTLRPVAGMRRRAAAITAAGLPRQRLPVRRADDEIARLAATLNAMLDRIDSATSRQRTFVGDAAHELRSPLASLRVQLEVSQRLGPDTDWSEVIDDVLVDVDRLDRLVEDLLTLARLDESAGQSRREPVRLDELVTTLVEGYASARVPVRARTQPVEVSGDAEALRRVVINLVNNALRYATSLITVDLSTTRDDGRPAARLVVEDDGPGIPEAERLRVFDRFYRVQESRSRDTGGTGLGLPIVRDIARNHGGRVQLSGRADGEPGLRAELVLPALDGTG